MSDVSLYMDSLCTRTRNLRTQNGFDPCVFLIENQRVDLISC